MDTEVKASAVRLASSRRFISKKRRSRGRTSRLARAAHFPPMRLLVALLLAVFAWAPMPPVSVVDEMVSSARRGIQQVRTMGNQVVKEAAVAVDANNRAVAKATIATASAAVKVGGKAATTIGKAALLEAEASKAFSDSMVQATLDAEAAVRPVYDGGGSIALTTVFTAMELAPHVVPRLVGKTLGTAKDVYDIGRAQLKAAETGKPEDQATVAAYVAALAVQRVAPEIQSRFFPEKPVDPLKAAQAPKLPPASSSAASQDLLTKIAGPNGLTSQAANTVANMDAVAKLGLAATVAVAAWDNKGTIASVVSEGKNAFQQRDHGDSNPFIRRRASSVVYDVGHMLYPLSYQIQGHEVHEHTPHRLSPLNTTTYNVQSNIIHVDVGHMLYPLDYKVVGGEAQLHSFRVLSSGAAAQHASKHDTPQTIFDVGHMLYPLNYKERGGEAFAHEPKRIK